MCCLLHMIKQIYLLKPQILMTQVSLYLLLSSHESGLNTMEKVIPFSTFYCFSVLTLPIFNSIVFEIYREKNI